MDMCIGNTNATIIVSFGTCIDDVALMYECKRMFSRAAYLGQYLRFENVLQGMHINSWEINPQYFEYCEFIKTYRQVIKDHIYGRTRKW